MFLTKKFKENNHCDILETLCECNFYIVKVSKLVNVFNKSFYYKPFFMCFLYFSKVWWVLKNEGVMFLMVPPNCTYTHVAKLSIFRQKKRGKY